MKDMNELLPDIKLLFNIEHPSFEDCYADGYEAAVAELPEEENPYQAGTEASEQWIEGWWAGFYGEKPIYDSSLDEEQISSMDEAANDDHYSDFGDSLLVKILEISGVIAVTALLGFQLIDLVA